MKSDSNLEMFTEPWELDCRATDRDDNTGCRTATAAATRH